MAQIFARNIGRGKCLNVLSSNVSNSGRSLANNVKDQEIQKHYRPYKSIPNVPYVPLLGSTWTYFPVIGKYRINKMHKADIDKHMVYGDMVREKFGTLEIVNCYNPNAMYVMMKEDDEYPSRGDFSTLKAYRNKRRNWYKPGGLLVTEGNEWKDLRDAVHAYTSKPDFLDYYIEPMNEIGTDFMDLIRNSRDRKQEIKDVVSYLNKWSLEAISLVALDKRLGCLVPNLDSTCSAMELIKAIEIQLECMNKLETSAGNIPFWKYLPTPTWRKFVQAADTFTSLAFNNLAESALKAREVKGDGRLSLLQHLTKTENGGVSSAMVLMTDLMMAGIDTTAKTAGFLLYELAKNVEKQQTVVKELNTMLPGKEDKLTFEKYKGLKYLKNCLKESMRLHPVVRGNVRIFKKDVVINGYGIPAGTPVICVLQVVYRDSKYFPKPNKFYPERWEEEELYPFFQPFGYGARNCIGNSLAELEILTMTTEILRKFNLEYHYEDIDMTTKLINAPDRPIKLRLLER